ncbi:hypothetical protein D9Q98_000990 [Chlorella vulgaris]|uniref:Uncharacterized protein n=1 Tax=Chlorella vulgaris TaxID=3077 RepID=A0A9D4Z1Q1_CHLVU|nr:hypothetical protein D9Q98_000990 [Chlorella vulgaris]
MQELSWQRSSSSSSGKASSPPRLEGRFSYKMIKAQPLEVLLNELRCRRMPTWGRKDQIASRLYTVFTEDGRALNKEESALADAELGLNDEQGGEGGTSSGDEEGGGSSTEMASSVQLQRNPLLALQGSVSGQFLTEHNQERLMSNVANLQVSFLWGATAPNGIKHTTTCVVRTVKSVWLFECGEDTQRHLSRSSTIAWVKLERIFVSSLASDNIMGLPGMLCTISASREKGHENADTPVHVYGPQGLADFINTMLSVSRTYLEMPVVIHEFVTTAVPPEELDVAVPINPRSRLYLTRLPPDQLNPEGYYDAELRTLLARHTRKRSNSGIDLRAGVLPLPLPEPGDPGRTGVKVADMTWSLRMDHEWVVRVAPLRNRQPAFGFLLQEADRTGRLYVDRAVEMGVQPGPDFTTLKEGRSVETPDGNTVHSSDVLGPSRRGRRLAVIGSCLDSQPFATAMASGAAWGASPDVPQPPCDVVVHSMTYPAGTPPQGADAGAAPPCGAAAMAGATAALLGAKDLVLWQQSTAFMASPQAADPDFPAALTAEAKAALGSGNVSLAGCYWCYQPEREEEAMPEWATGGGPGSTPQ